MGPGPLASPTPCGPFLGQGIGRVFGPRMTGVAIAQVLAHQRFILTVKLASLCGLLWHDTCINLGMTLYHTFILDFWSRLLEGSV